MWKLIFQVQVFALTLLVGMITGVIFQYYQCVMALSRINRYVLYCLDFFVWVLAVMLVFSLLLVINQGEIRAYVLLALLIGLFVYFRCAAPATRECVRTAACLTVRAAAIFKVLGGYLVAWTKRRIQQIVERFSHPQGNDDNEE